MTPTELLQLDPLGFDRELAGLLTEGANSYISTSSPPPLYTAVNLHSATPGLSDIEAEDADTPGQGNDSTPLRGQTSFSSAIINSSLPRSNAPINRKRGSTSEATPCKKQKLKSEVQDVHVHASRQVLQDRPPPSSISAQAPIDPTLTLQLRHLSASGANGQALRSPDGTTWKTVRNVVRRQWDTRKDDLAYEALLELRRNEKIVGVDRYVPPSPPVPLTGPCRPMRKPRKAGPFHFEKLPSKAKDIILSLLLTSDEPIRIDFTWLRAFVNGHARVPSAMQTLLSDDGGQYDVAMQWDTLVDSVAQMKTDMQPFITALEEKARHSRRKAPCRRLTTALLRVSRSIHERAAPIFYSGNNFHFPWATSSWMQLESFLVTIGNKNVANLRRIRIHVPLWHRGVEQDFVEGALLDLTSLASRMAVLKPPSADRLLSAIKSCVDILLGSRALVFLSLDLEHGVVTDHWSSRLHDRAKLISAVDAENFTARKLKGMQLLQRLSASLGEKPLLTVQHPSRVTVPDVRNFRTRLAAVHGEAEKYGWKVNSRLKDTTK